jgi:ankyrin repeat protein
MVASLLDHGADVNFGAEDGLVPLGVAAWYDDADIVTELLNHGAKLEFRDDEGYTPLLEAASHAEGVRVLKILIAAGADIQARGTAEADTALMLAASSANLDAVRLLSSLGLNACLKDKHGEMAAGYVNPLVKPDVGKEIRKLLQTNCGPS